MCISGNVKKMKKYKELYVDTLEKGMKKTMRVTERVKHGECV